MTCTRSIPYGIPSLSVLPSEFVLSSKPPRDCLPCSATGCRITAALRTGLPLSSFSTTTLREDACPESFFLSPATSKGGTRSTQMIATRKHCNFIRTILGSSGGVVQFRTRRARGSIIHHPSASLRAGSDTEDTEKTRTHLINRSGMYQGTTFSRAEPSAGKVSAFAPAKTGPSGAEAQVVVDPLRHV